MLKIERFIINYWCLISDISVNILVRENWTEYAKIPDQLKRFKQFVFKKKTFGTFL